MIQTPGIGNNSQELTGNAGGMNAELETGVITSPNGRQGELSPDQTSLLAAIVQSSTEAIIAKTLDGTVVAWNPAAERIYGFTAQEAIGQPVTLIIPPDKVKEYLDIMERLKRGEEIEPFETVRVRKDGRRLNISLSISPIRNASGELVGASAIGVDITRARELEHARRSTEERLNLAMEVTHIGVWEWNLDTDRVRWSPNLESIHKMEPGTFTANFAGVISNVYLEDRNKFISIVSEATRTGKDFRVEYRLAHSPETWVAGQGKLIDMGASKSVIGICLDVTEQKRVEKMMRGEATLRESEARLHELADVMPHMVWTMRSDGVITYANQRCIDYIGTNPGTLSFEATDRFVHPEDVAKAKRCLRSALKQGTAHQYEIRIRSKSDFYRWHTIRLIPIRDNHNNTIRWLGSATDIDLQRRAAQSLQHTTSALKRDILDRTQALNDSIASFENLLYNIGHHLRAPLRAMNGFARILLEDQQNRISRDAQDAANRIVSASTRMDRLIADLLAYGRASREEFPAERVDLDLQFRQLLRRFNQEIATRRAHILLRGPLPRVWANPIAAGLVLDHIFNNALKFVPPERAPQIEIWAERKEGFVRIYIKDNGIGIAPEYQSKIFQLFETLHSHDDYAGTGVGLAICHKVMNRVNGTIGMTSSPDQGSTFWVEFASDPTDRLPFTFNPSDFSFLPEADGIVITGSDGRIRWINAAFEKTCGYTLEEMLGCKPGDLLQGPGSDPVEVQKLRKAIRSKVCSSVAIVNYRKDHERYWTCLAVCPIRRRGEIEGYASVQREVQIPIQDETQAQLRHELRKLVRILRRAPMVR